MEGEINKFVMVWITVLASLWYCHTIAKFIPKGTTRFLTIFPISCLFVLLPLNLTSIHLGGVTSFFIAWLANFKLLLFGFGKGPLSSNPPIPMSLFIPLACLPIKIHNSNQEYPSSQKIPEKGHKSGLNYVIKILLLAFLIKVYDYKDYLHPKFILLLYCFHIYLSLELLLAMFGTLARALIHAELEPQFDEPYLSTSLQDFWGKRWNLMVSNILRPTVFDPVRSISTLLIGRKWAALPGVFATFFVSGLMHEVIFYNFGRQKTRWQVMCFFIIHGASLAIEIGLKKAVNGKFRLPPTVSGPLAVMFVVVTSFWLFFPPFLRGKADMKACTESLAFLEFVRSGKLISPNDITCPYL